MLVGLGEALLGLIVVLYGVFGDRERSAKRKKIEVIIGLLFFGFGLNTVYETELDARIDATSGVLEGQTLIEDETEILAEGRNIKVRIGTTCVPINHIIPKGSNTVRLMKGMLDFLDPVYLTLENGKILVTTTLRDDRGIVIAEIDKNKWTLNKNSYFQRNYSDTALEVIGNDGRVVLQLILLDGEVLFQASIFNKKGIKWTIADHPTWPGAVLSPTWPGEKPLLEINIPRYFKYPSSENLGVVSIEQQRKRNCGERTIPGYILGNNDVQN